MQTKIIQKGSVLIARPTLLTDVFHRSVVLLTDHSPNNGSIGFVLNKPLTHTVNDFLQDINSNAIVYEGGPVDQENIFYIHKRPDLISESEKITENLFWSGHFDDVKHALNNGYINDDEIRFYLGYSGWASEQLQTEIENNAWNINNELNFDFFDKWKVNLWKEQMKNLGGENLIWFNMPDNPMLN
ncbi:MAG: YqgE/AlgH family protein [Flavobacteriaceae bacterium]|nr:YqgE/AlgH family protein [Flavobacteriaceae bacterium]